MSSVIETTTHKDLRATWLQALVTFLAPILAVVAFRWLLFEPFVIPSESMVPNLLVHDHILANKTAYGIRQPFSNGFLLSWATPKRGEIIVFKYPKNLDTYFIKRVIGLPGDRIRLEKGRLFINGISQDQVLLDSQDQEFRYFKEGVIGYNIRYNDRESQDFAEVTVPEKQLFVMGDNRNYSADSRVWGFVPLENVVGRAAAIWLSCEETLPTAPMLCNPQLLRWSRIFTGIN